MKTIAFAYNCTVHSVTGESPNFLVLRRELRSPVDVVAVTNMDDMWIKGTREGNLKKIYDALNRVRERIASHSF